MKDIDIGLEWVDHLLGKDYPFDPSIWVMKAPARKVLAFLERMHGLLGTMVITTEVDGMVETVRGWTRGYKEATEGAFVTAAELEEQRVFLVRIRHQIAADKTWQQEQYMKDHALKTGLEPTPNAEVAGRPWGKEKTGEKGGRERREEKQNMRCADAARKDAMPLSRAWKRVRH